MNKSKIKKYVGKNVTVYFRHKHKHKTARGIIEYKPKEPLNDYFLYQPQCSGGSFMCYIALEPKMIGHIKIQKVLENE